MLKTRNNKVTTNKYNDRFSSLIRPIQIFLPEREGGDSNYKYADFVGRERLMERLFNWLSDTKNENGSYLVTGFRGMGKTSLVNRVTERLTREIKQTLEFLCFIMLAIPVIGFGVLHSNSIELGGFYFYVLVALPPMLIGLYLVRNKYETGAFPHQHNCCNSYQFAGCFDFILDVERYKFDNRLSDFRRLPASIYIRWSTKILFICNIFCIDMVVNRTTSL